MDNQRIVPNEANGKQNNKQKTHAQLNSLLSQTIIFTQSFCFVLKMYKICATNIKQTPIYR